MNSRNGSTSLSRSPRQPERADGRPPSLWGRTCSSHPPRAKPAQGRTCSASSPFLFCWDWQRPSSCGGSARSEMRRVALNLLLRCYPWRAVNHRTTKCCESIRLGGGKRIDAAALVLLIAATLLAAPRAGSFRQDPQQAGAIEFTARVKPTGGRAEPVRGVKFYLLRHGLAHIEKEVEETEVQPDLDRFINGLEVSDQLKAWMKKKRSVELAGTDFIR